MTAEEKMIYYTRESLKDKHGEEFSSLTEDEQNESVLQEIQRAIQEHIEQMRKEHKHR